MENLRYNLTKTFTSRCDRSPLKPDKKVTDLEVVEGLHLPADGVQLGVVLGLDVSDGLGQLVLPELAVLRCGVAVGKSGQFLQLLCMDTASVLLSHFLECKVHMERVSGLARSWPRDKSVLLVCTRANKTHSYARMYREHTRARNHAYTHIHTHTHARTHAYTHTHTHTYTRTHAHAHTHTHTHTLYKYMHYW